MHQFSSSKLKALFILFFLVVLSYGKVLAQCGSLPGILSLNSGKTPTGLCSPVTTDVNYDITFATPLSTGLPNRLFFRWNDGSADEFVILADGSTTYNVVKNHAFPTDSDCEYEVEIILTVGGAFCTATQQLQKITSWRTDEFNGGNVQLIDPNSGTNVYEVCEGVDISIVFDDLTDYNCNATYDPLPNPPNDVVIQPNEQYRWQQIVYNTPIAGAKIPNISVDGVPVTGAGGADIIANYEDSRGVFFMSSPVVINDARRRPTLTITAPGGFGAGFPVKDDEFEITIRYWNYCNPYDDPAIAGTPVDIINGDHAPVEATALIRIIDSPDAPSVSPTPQIYCQGQTDASYNLTASGVGITTFRWYSDAALTSLVKTGASFNPITEGSVNKNPAVPTTTNFYVTGEGALTCVSDATLVPFTIHTNMNGGTISHPLGASPKAICTGTNPASFINSVSASGGDGINYNYQWQSSTTSSGGPWSDIGGETSTTYNPPSLTQTTWYRRRVRSNNYNISGSCDEAFSNVYEIQVDQPVNGGTIGNSQTICTGDDPASITNSSLPSGGNGTFIYSWESSTTSVAGPFSTIGGASSSTYDPPILTQTTWYRRRSESGVCTPNFDYSNVVEITVDQLVAPGVINNSQTICYSDDPAVLGETTPPSGGDGVSYTFLWEQSATGGGVGFAAASGINTGSTYDPPNLTSTTFYRRRVSSGVCSVAYSNEIEVTVNPLPTGDVSGGGSVCGANPAPDIVFTMTGTGPFQLTYERDGNPTTIASTTSPFTISSPTLIDGGSDVYIITDVVDLGVTPNCSVSAPSANITGSATVVLGGASPTLSNFVVDGPVCESNGTPTIPFWHVDVDVAGDYDIDYTINGAPQSTISTGVLGAATTFDYQVLYTQLGSSPGTYTIALTTAVNITTGCVATLPGNTVDIVINPDPADPSNPVDAIACSSDATGATLAVDDPGAGFTVEWYSDMTLTTPAIGSTVGSNNGELFTPNSNATASYYAIITDDASACPSVNYVTLQHTQDIQPAAADADLDDDPAFLETCTDQLVLEAIPADNGGTGTWSYNGLLYFEDFNNLADGTVANTDQFGWSIDVSAASFGAGDHFEVTNNYFEGDDTDGIVIWESDPIDISAIVNFDISVDVSENNGTANDFIELYYQIDANPEQQVGATQSGGFGSTTLSGSFATGGGSSIIIRIKVDSRGNNDEVRFDNVSLVETGSTTVTFSNVNDPNATVSNLPGLAAAVQSTTLIWTVTSQYDVCASSSDNVVVNRNPIPANNDPLPELCEDQPLGSNVVAGVDLTIAAYSDAITGIVGSAGRTIEYYDDPGRLVVDLIPDPTNVDINNGTIIYTRVLDTSTSAFTSCSQDGTMTFTVHTLPEAIDQDDAVNPAETEFCEDFPVGSGVTTGIDLTALDNDVVNNTANRSVAWFTDVSYSVPVPDPTNASANDGELFYPRVTETSSGQSCTNDAVVTITVNSRPADNPILGANTQCVGGPTSLYQISPGPSGTTYDWNIPAQFTVFGGGTINDFFVLLQFPTATTQTLEVTEITPDGCDGNLQQLSITVQASPPISAITGPAAVCSNEAGVVYSVTNTANTDYAWTVPTGASIILGQGTSSITVNFGSTGGNVEVVPSTQGGGCTGGTATQAVTINPRPILDPGLSATVCSANDISITLAADGSSPVAAANYNVTASVSPGLVANTGPTTGAGITAGAIFNDNYTNTTGGPLTVTYTVTPVSADNCTGSSVNVVATINPEPVMATGLGVTECSDNAIGITLNTAAGSVVAATYNITAVTIPGSLTPGGSNATFPQNGVADSYIAGDTYTNTGNSQQVVQYTVVPVSAAGCPGNSLVINATIDPEPVVSTTLDNTVCSDNAIALSFATNGVSVAAANYNLINVSIPGGLTAGGSNAAFPANGVASNYVVSDTYTNQTTLPIDVTYEIQGVSAAGCIGDNRVINITIDPEPVMNAGLSTTVCSDDVSGITFAFVGTAVAANDYNVIGVTIPAGATPAGGNAAFPASNVVAGYISNDSYTNQTAASIDVTYEVRGVSAAGCEGDSEFIVLTVDPEPVVDPALDVTVCSDDAIGVTLNTNGTSVAAANYDLLNINIPAGLTAGGSNVVVSNGVAANYINADTYTNTTNASLMVTYEVRGTAAGTGCKGDSEFIVVTVDPEPVISNSLNTTVCSDLAIGVTLATNGISIAAANYNIVSVTIPAGLTPAVGNATFPQNGVASGYITNDKFTNITAAPLNVLYDVQGVSGTSCIGDVKQITVTINPEPVVNTSLDATVCSDNAIGVNLSIEGGGVAAVSYNYVAVTLDPGLSAGANAVIPANGQASNYIAGDTYTNTTVNSLDAVYEVKGVSGLGCIGDSEFITVTIDPEPIVSNSLNATVCSSSTIGLSLSTTVASEPAVSYNVLSVSMAAGLAAGGSNAVIPGNAVVSSYLANDTFINTTSGSLNVTYQVQGISVKGCVGDTRAIVMTIDPEPVVNTGLDKTVCSDENIAISLSTNGTSVAAANYNIKSITIPVGVTASGTNVAVPASGVNTSYIFNDSYTNKTAGALVVIYEVTGVSAAPCEGQSEFINVTIDPEPVVDPLLDATVCSDEPVGVVLGTDGVSVAAATYNIVSISPAAGLVAGGGNMPAANGVADNYFVNDTYTNKTLGQLNVVYEVRGVSGAGCVGDSELVTVTINPEPIVNTSLDKTVCSDEVIALLLSTDPSSVGAANYNVVNINVPAGLTPGGSNVTAANGVASNYIADDVFTNLTNGSLNVTYEVQAVSASNCTGDSEFIIVTVDPEPVIDATLDASVCSDNAIGLNFATAVTSVAAANYNLIAVNVGAGLIAGGSNVVPANGIGAAYVANDVYTNTTNASIDVTYEVKGVSADNCIGDSRVITITVDPEPVMDNSLSTTQCSDLAIGVNLAGDGISVAPANFNIVSVTIPGALTPNGGNAVFPANNVAANYISNDIFTNVSSSSLDVVYEVRGVSAAGCVGDSEFITATIDPEPVISLGLGTTVCSDDAVGVTLATNGTSIGAANYDLLSVAIDPGLTAAVGNATVANNVAAGYFTNDTYTNQTAGSLNVVYEVRGHSAAGCEGDIELINVTVNPEPVVDPGLDKSVCSDGATGLVLNTNGTSIGASNYNIIGVAIDPSLTPAAGNAAIPAAGVAAAYLSSDSYTNATSSSKDVVYEVRGVSFSACEGDSEFITITIEPGPVIDPNLDATVCSDVAIGVNFSVDVGSVAATSYNLVGITPNPSLVPGGGNVGTASGVAANYIASDTYTNTTSIPLNVVYEVKGISAATCQGPSEFITVTIDPEPVIDNGLNKTVCSDEGVGLILITNGVSVGANTYNVISVAIDPGLTPNVGNASIPQAGVSDSYLSADAYTNTTGGQLTVTYEARAESSSTCEGDSKFIIITVDPEPVMSNALGTIVCSDDPSGITLSVQGGSVGAANYNLVSVTVPGGLTANASNAVIPANGVAPGYISADKYTNQTNGPLNVLYDVRGVSADGCEGDSEVITLTIDPEPVVDPSITSTVCSDDISGIILGVSGTSTAAASYDIVGVTIPAGLTAGANAVVPASAVAAGYLNSDTYTNQTSSPINVTYEVKGNSGAGCQGDSEFIVVTVNPEPVLNPGLNTTVCSNDVVGVVFSTNGTSVSASSYNLVSVTPSAGLLPGASNAMAGNGVANSHIQNDTFENTTAGDLTVDYIVAPVSLQGCVGDQVTVTITIHPQPVLDPLLSPTPVCSDIASGVTLAVDAGSIAAASYNIVGITFNPGLVPGGSNASIGNGQAATAIIGDTYTNTTNTSKQATYDIVPVSADGCEGAVQQVVFTVNPAPALATNLDKIICSGGTTGITLGTNGTSTPAANYNITAVNIPVGISAGANAVVPANNQSTVYLSADTYTNTTNAPLVVDYTVVPVSGAGCEGPAATVSVTVEPDFIANANNTKPTICSNDITDITLTSPSTASAGNIVFNVTAVASSGTISGFSPSLSFLPQNYVIADNLINGGNTVETVTYTITPLAPGAASGLSCTGASIIEVVTVDPLPIITPGQSEVTCSDDAINYTITTTNGLAGTTFTWPAPTLPAGVTGGTARVVASSDPITDVFTNTTASRQVVVYQVTPYGPSALSCVGNTVNVQVYVDPLPDGTISVDKPVVCYGSSALLSFAMTVGTAPFEIVYNDGTSDITVSNIANSHFIAVNNLTATTTYTFKSIKDVNGCVQTLSGQDVTITVENPIADFSMDIDEDCTPLEVTFTNNNVQPGTVYEWNFGDGSPVITSSDPTVTHTYINNSTVSDVSFSPLLTATITNGTVICTHSMTDFVTVHAGVSLNVTPSATEGCSPLTVNFDNISSGVLSSKWFWREKGTTDENEIQTSFLASYTLSNTTTSNIVYEVVYEGERNGCSDQAITEITVYPEVEADFTVDPGTTISIEDPTITVTNTSLNKNAWVTQWDWGDGESTTNVDPGSHTYAVFGEYELKLTIKDPNGVCESVKTEIITVEPTVPAVDFSVDVTEGCMPLTVQFTNLSTSVDPDTYVWTLVDDTGRTVATSTLENPEITFFEPGIINVTLSGSNPLGVIDTETKLGLIEVYDLPTASFSVRPETVFLPDQVMFTANLSKQADAFEWDFNGDGIPESDEFEPSFKYTEPGVYDVSLIAVNTATGCSDTTVIEKAVTVVESGTSDIPNGFFPGSGQGDDGSGGGSNGGAGGSNTVFLPRIKGVRDDGFKMQVFDRWGHLLFESEDKTKGWNGRHFNTGKLMPAGVYVYKLELVYVSGQQTTVVGDINLIR